MSDKKRDLRVKELVVRDVITVLPDDPLTEAVSLMSENRISAMPVVDNRNRCKGIISTTDLVRVLRDYAEGRVDESGADATGSDVPVGTRVRTYLDKRRVGEVMTEDVMTVSLEEPILNAAREMVRSRVHRLAVTDSNNRVIGIVSTLDLLEALSADD